MVQQNYSSQTLLEKKFNLMCVYEYLHNFQKVNSSKSVDGLDRNKKLHWKTSMSALSTQ